MLDKFLNKHMKIERMIATCGIMLLLIFSVVIYDSVVLYNRSRVTLSDEPILSGGATTSLTETSFSIQGIYRSKDKTQAMIVLSGDLSATSYAADTYKVYLSGPSAETYSGGIYAFGNLNLLCVYVTNINGFNIEKTELLIKCMASSNANTSEQTDDMTFEINLGAKNVQDVSFMDDSGLNVELMAESAFFHDEDAQIRESLTDMQQQMVSARTSLSNIRQNIEKIGIELPVAPEWMMYKSKDENGNEQEMLDQIGKREGTGSQYIQTSYIFAGAADFDWENTTRLNNYAEAAGISINDIKTPDSSNKESEDKFIRPSLEESIPTEWYKSDGSVITEPTSSESALMTKYNDTISNYYNTKVMYQDTVASLILAQNRYVEAISDYTSSVGNGAIIGVKQK